ncbi:GAF domain-containing protein [Sphingomonas vulcanisoli]|uniref:GAF domain-containing protein n=1 Tax=Sphingomonas vulcanisoli TaxID=1658060 RepID=A0ABX0TMF5_9SPHN|nr:GAF domain-containing protein [Sphingomonas vulcanisoli]NIJ06698.1 GAF domain-containing protein [Sphingomonas vulcanisoli]
MANGWIIDEEARLQTLRSFGILDSAAEDAFDTLVEKASALCETPVALITLLDRDRQWFKAAIGTEIRETPIELAICTHALAHGGTLVITDLSEDERTSSNPLVASEPHARFYAGSPIVVEGQALGTLCVLSFAPRPKGLSEVQRSGLEGLATEAARLIVKDRLEGKAVPADRR